ncbi:DeoR/GlpR family DNA-binding transcription regulator [Acetoanaerobium noterae]|jgi:DeoR family fructose operon transcriptional repressor|uniref:DeoR/GlpR family DNA-binding transcription regulator n=1 Tax=Acetoanaerobium noterae TaxID=745369 RepID=UPI0028A9920A|nr:DeoR/GlpR family DNA-binding transcription regulator [Acetoanaerobium noterae]
MYPEERREKICEIVNAKKTVRVSELGELLETSEVTIRRDLEELHKRNLLVRTHGGAVASYSVSQEPSAIEFIRTNERVEEKRIIAEIAYRQILEGETIFLDGSSTVYELAKIIAEGSKSQLRIITASLTNANAFERSDNANVLILGGDINRRHNNLEGYLTNMNIRNLRADKCFVGINGIDEGFGFSTTNFPEAEQKMEMIKSSIKSYVLADHSKFGKSYMAKVDADCDFIITNKKIREYNYDWLDDKATVLFPET